MARSVMSTPGQAGREAGKTGGRQGLGAGVGGQAEHCTMIRCGLFSEGHLFSRRRGDGGAVEMAPLRLSHP